MFKRALLAPFFKKHAKQWGASSTPYTQCKVASGPAAATLVAPVAQPRPPPGDPGGDGDGDGDGPGGDAPDDPRRNVPYDTAIFLGGMLVGTAPYMFARQRLILPLFLHVHAMHSTFFSLPRERSHPHDAPDFLVLPLPDDGDMTYNRPPSGLRIRVPNSGPLF